MLSDESSSRDFISNTSRLRESIDRELQRNSDLILKDLLLKKQEKLAALKKLTEQK